MKARNVYLISVSSLLFGLIVYSCICSYQKKVHTEVYKIVENNSIWDKDNFTVTKVKEGMIYYYLDKDMEEKTKSISKDSTYFYNTTDEDWLLYSVDYKVWGKDVKIPEEIYIIIPPHSMVGYAKITSYIGYGKPSQDETLYNYEAKRGYTRKMFLRKASVVLEEANFINSLIPSLDQTLKKQ